MKFPLANDQIEFDLQSVVNKQKFIISSKLRLFVGKKKFFLKDFAGKNFRGWAFLKNFAGKNFREKAKKPRNRESFFPRKFLTLK